MLVRDRMTPDPVIIGPQAMLATAQEYMTVGHFRRLPVIDAGTLVGIITDRDIRRHAGSEAADQSASRDDRKRANRSPRYGG